MMIGIAGLVATASFRVNVEEALDKQSRTLLGADLVVRSRQPFTTETNALLRDLGGQQSRQTSFMSMAYFAKTGGTRLVRVRALEGDFPYYGELETDPPEASQRFRSGAFALVDDALMTQFGAQVGDPIKLGHATFQIVGRLKKIPGETAFQSFVGPRIYIADAQLPQTGLLQPGSRVTHHRFYKFHDDVEVETLSRELQAKTSMLGIRIETVDTRRQRFGGALTHVAGFLNLIGFIAVLLAGIAVASAVHVYIKQKVATVGLLRCLGTPRNATFAVYVVQVAVIALLGGLAGSLLGIALQRLLPALLADFLPTRVNTTLNWTAIFEGTSVGLASALLFGSFPLLSVRSVTPLQVLSGSAGTTGRASNRALVLTGSAIVILITVFAFAHTATWQQAAIFTGGLFGAILTLGVTSHGLIKFTRRVALGRVGYVWRQGLANLHRPNNQTPVLLLSLGLATFLIATVYLSQQMLLGQVALAEQKSEGNFVLFDVQSDQAGPLNDLLTSFGVQAKHEAPIVSMRLSTLNGKTVNELRKTKTGRAEEWALRHEYRATYRNHLINTEKLIQGRWPVSTEHATEPYPVSLEAGIAHSLGATVGDEMVFDVQGIPVTTRVTGIREVEWRRLQPNFFLVFPPGVLEEAPQTQALVTRVDTTELSAKLQRAVVTQFPNIAMIDLRFVLGALTTLLDRIALAIRFIGSFSVIAGVFVLLGAITTSRYHRFRENLLLRTLGASRLQILQITAVEYFFLGAISAVAGLGLSLASAWGLGYYLFDSALVVEWSMIVATLTVVIVLTVITGLLGSWGTFDQSPLELLRNE